MTTNTPAGNVGAIGVFDSGLGGLTVLRALLDLLPDDPVVYFGDTGRFPYGPHPRHHGLAFSFPLTALRAARGVQAPGTAVGCGGAVITIKPVKDVSFFWSRALRPPSSAKAAAARAHCCPSWVRWTNPPAETSWSTA